MIFTCDNCGNEVEVVDYLEWFLRFSGYVLRRCEVCDGVTKHYPVIRFDVKDYRVKTYEEFLRVNGL